MLTILVPMNFTPSCDLPCIRLILVSTLGFIRPKKTVRYPQSFYISTMQIDLACPVGTTIMSETLFIMNEFKLDPTSTKARIIRPRLKIREGVRRYAPEINLQGPAGSWLGVWKMKQTNKQMNQNIDRLLAWCTPQGWVLHVAVCKASFCSHGLQFSAFCYVVFCSLISCTARHSFNPDTVEFGLLDMKRTAKCDLFLFLVYSN